MGIEKQPNTPRHENIDELYDRIDALSYSGRNEEAVALIERLPEGEEKYYRIAYIGHNYADSHNWDKVREIFKLLSQSEDSLAYAGGVLELIPEDEREALFD